MWTFIGIICLIAFFVFIVKAILSYFKKTGKGKHNLKLAGLFFVLTIVALALTPTSPDSASEEETKDEAQDKTQNEKKAEEEKAAKEDKAKKKKAEEAEAKKKEEKKKAAQQTPEAKLKSSITKAIGSESNRKGKKLSELSYNKENGNIDVTFKGDENLTTNLTVTGIKMDIADLLEAVKKSGVDYENVHVMTTYSMVDQYGNAEESKVIDLTYSKATIDKINFENFLTENVYSVADVVGMVHPEFVGKKNE